MVLLFHRNSLSWLKPVIAKAWYGRYIYLIFSSYLIIRAPRARFVSGCSHCALIHTAACRGGYREIGKSCLYESTALVPLVSTLQLGLFYAPRHASSKLILGESVPSIPTLRFVGLLCGGSERASRVLSLSQVQFVTLHCIVYTRTTSHLQRLVLVHRSVYDQASLIYHLLHALHNLYAVCTHTRTVYIRCGQYHYGKHLRFQRQACSGSRV